MEECVKERKQRDEKLMKSMKSRITGRIALLRNSSSWWTVQWIETKEMQLVVPNESVRCVSVAAYLPHGFGYRRWHYVCVWHHLAEPRYLKPRESISSNVEMTKDMFK